VSRWQNERPDFDANEYDARWEQLRRAGKSVHGEADFVMTFAPKTVLDAGCGTGRVALELAARGVSVVGVDLDIRMIDAAREKAAGSDNPKFMLRDLSELQLATTFDVVVAPGNVMIFLEPGTEKRTVAQLAAHVAPGGVLIAGFQLRPGGYSLDQYDEDCNGAGLILERRYSTWEGDRFVDGGDYAVSVHAPM
jgi:2-polyprenyl-3-methyl-5-hydroxy-6-metoxy-1,4-benzoquinol methylase